MPIFVSTGPLASILPFNGESSENTEKWVQTYDYITTANGYSEQMRCAQLPTYLKGRATTWYSTVDVKICMDYKRLQEDFLETFYDKRTPTERYHKMNQQNQRPTESVVDYSFDKKLLCRQYDPKMTEETLIVNFCSGLREEIQKSLRCKTFKTLVEAIKAAEDKEGGLTTTRLEAPRRNENQDPPRVARTEETVRAIEERRPIQRSS